MDGHTELLLTLAEVSVAFAGFASVTVLFKKRDSGEWSISDAHQYRSMLRGSLAACLLSLLPVILSRSGAAPAATWVGASIGLLAYALWVSRPFFFLYGARVPISLEIAIPIVATSLVIIGQLLNLLGIWFHREAAPVLLGLGLLVTIAAFNFCGLVVVHPGADRPAA